MVRRTITGQISGSSVLGHMEYGISIKEDSWIIYKCEASKALKNQNLWALLEGSNNLSASTDIYMLKGFVICFKLCLFTDCDYINFPSQTCQHQNFLIRTLSYSLLEFSSSVFLKSSSNEFLCCSFLHYFLVWVHPMISTT